MLTFMLVMVPAVFFINALSKSPSVVADDDIVKLPALAGQTGGEIRPCLRFFERAIGSRRQSGPGGLPTFPHQQ
jgi:hypothetical protein